MNDVIDMSARRAKAPEPTRDTADWLEAADAEVQRVASSPNEVLARLLAAGCRITFHQEDPNGSVTADVTLPDGSVVSETGINAVAALVFAYGAGAYLADLPAILTATVQP